jgi:uncharacterized protein YcgI (DUF1989 family)
MERHPIIDAMTGLKLKDLDAFVFKDTPVDEGQIRELDAGDFIDAKRNLILIGGTEPAS